MTRIPPRILIGSFFILFAISTVILLIASTATTPLPAWAGYLDVGIVLLIAASGISIHSQNKNKPRYDLSHHVAVYTFPLIFVGLWLFRDMLDFNIILPGLAWRTFFFLSILPHALTLWKLGLQS